MEFRTVIEQVGNNTGILVPDSVVDELGGGRRPAVTVQVGGHSYRSTISSMGGQFLIPLSAAHRASAGVVGGQEVTVVLDLDTRPREVDVPADLAAALAAEPNAAAYFATLSYSNRSRHVVAINEAKTEATRQRRIEKSVALFAEGKS